MPLNKSEKSVLDRLELVAGCDYAPYFLRRPRWTYHPPPRPHVGYGRHVSTCLGWRTWRTCRAWSMALRRRRVTQLKAKHARDKRESEFNHHLAGVLVILAALFFLGQPALTKRWPDARYAWPVCFLIAGIFLLVFSDTEIWPFGNQSLIYAMTA